MSITQLLQDGMKVGYLPVTRFRLYFSREHAEQWLLIMKMFPPSNLGGYVNLKLSTYYHYLATMDTDTYEFIRVQHLRSTTLEYMVPSEYELAEEMSYEEYNKWLEENNK